MKTVGAGEAKTPFAQLLDAVERGEEVTITRHGRAVAKLVAVKPARDPAEIAAAVDAIRALSSRNENVDMATIKEWIEYGRE